MSKVEAWVAPGAKQHLIRQRIGLGPLGAEEVEVQVEHCGLCHSDLSILNDEWSISKFPAVLGHEVIGKVVAAGDAAGGVTVGQRVGIGWNAGSCMRCRSCRSGDNHLCNQAQPTIVGHRGGFASHVRAHWAWAIPLPLALDVADAGPLLCGGITVFNPLASFAKPTSRVGIVGIGGLGHMGVKFAAAYGCEVVAFTSSPAKFEEAKSFGAHRVVATRDAKQVRELESSLDLLIVTTNVQLDWNALISTLRPHGRMHVVGAVTEPIPVPVISLIWRQASISGSPTGSPTDIETMLEFAARHKIVPTTEHYPMREINQALDRLSEGKARYRIVLDADFD
jgi:alcohol/geraniol dehydrogenase (NADP+)